LILANRSASPPGYRVLVCNPSNATSTTCSSAKVSSALSLLALIPTLIARLIFALLFP